MTQVLATIRLTPFQAQEVSWGLFIDETDGADPWGALRPIGKAARSTCWRRDSGADLDVYDLNAAIYRVTSSRDICRDNDSHGQVKSLSLLTFKLVVAAGGPNALPPETKRWL